MKKLSVFLIFILIIGMISPVVYASGDTIEFSALDYAGISNASIYEADGCIQIRAGGYALYQVDLGTMATDKITLRFRSNTSSRGSIDIRLGSASGEVIGTVDTVNTVPESDWYTYHVVDVYLSHKIQGNQSFVIYNNKGIYSLHNIFVNLVDPNAVARSIASMENADAFEDISNDSNKTEINLMTQLGVFDKTDKNFMPNTPLTRIEFMKMLGSLIDAEQYSSVISPFADVAEDDENKGLLSGLYNLGIIRGGTDGNFYPDTFITVEQLASVFVSALGYRVIPDSDVNALSITKRLKLFAGIDTSDKYVNKSEAAKFLYNLFIADYLKESIFSSKEIKYEKTSNFLEKMTEYYHGVGVVTANYDTALYTPRNDADNVFIGEERFYSKDVNTSDFLGILCEYFYYEKDGQKHIAAVYPSKKAKVEVYKSSKDVYFEEISEKMISVAVGDEEAEEYKLDSSTAIIYNGIALDKSLTSLIGEDKFIGTITLINNDGGDALDCVWIDHARSVVAGSVTPDRIYDSLAKEEIDLNNSIITLIVDGEAKDVKSIEYGDVLTVYQSVNSSGNKLVRIIGDRRIVSGKISQISYGKLSISGNEYEVDPKCNVEFYVGLDGNFGLNAYNLIVNYEKHTSEDYMLGMYMDVDYDSNGLNYDTKIKLLTEKQGIVICDFADKVILDGVTVKDAKDIYDGVGKFVGFDDVRKNTPVLYQLNSENQIVMMDTEKSGSESNEDSLTKIDENQEWRTLGNVLVNRDWIYKHPYRSTLKTIALNSEGIEDNYMILNGFDASEEWIYAVPYSFKKDSIIADLVISEDYEGDMVSGEEPFVFKKVSNAINNDGEVSLYIHGINSGAEVRYEMDADTYQGDIKKLVDSLKEGDLVQVGLTRSKISKIQLIYLPGGARTNSARIEAMINNTSRVSPDKAMIEGTSYCGNIVLVEDGFVQVDCGDKDINGNDIYRTWNFRGGVVTLNKTDSSKYDVVNNQELSAVFAGDTVVVYLSYRTIDSIYIYRNSQS